MEYTPKPPILRTKVFSSILDNEPTEIADSKVMDKETFESLISCTDRDSDTKVCTVSEWTSPNTPYKRVVESDAEVSKYDTRKRASMSFKKVAADESW